ncbi:2963_t:CDS:1, partial [Racocetra fulgida]
MDDVPPALDEFLSTDESDDLFDENGELKLPKYTIDEGILTRSRSGFKGFEGFKKSLKSGLDVVASGVSNVGGITEGVVSDVGAAVSNVGGITEGVVSNVGAAVSSVMGTTDDSEKDQQEK